MPGFSNNNVMYADNVDFSGSANTSPTMLLDGELLIGSTVAPHIRVANLTSNDGSVTITNSNGGINLSASSSTQGTFNPVITSDGTAPTGVTYNYNRGNYTKVGNLVHCDFQMGMSGYTAGTGSALIASFPFTSANTSETPNGTISFNNIALGVTTYSTLVMNANATTAYIWNTVNTTNYNFVASTAWNGFLTMSSSITYLV